MRTRLQPHEDPEEAIRVRDQNRQKLGNLHTEFTEFKASVQPGLAQLQRESRAMQQELQQVRNYSQQLQGSKQDIDALKSELQSLRGATNEIQQNRNDIQSLRGVLNEIQQVKSEVQLLRGVPDEVQQVKSKMQSLTGATDEIQTMKSELQSLRGAIMNEIQQNKIDIESLRGIPKEIRQIKSEIPKEIQQVKSEMQSLRAATKEIERMKNELQSVKGAQKDVQGLKNKLQSMEQVEQSVQSKQSEYQNELAQLKRGVQSNDALTALKAKTDLVTAEFENLKQQVYSRGLLAPIVEKPEDPEEPPPVGAVQLNEDAWTARLLIHLGFLKARRDAYLEAHPKHKGSVAVREKGFRSIRWGGANAGPTNSDGESHSYSAMREGTIELVEDENEALYCGDNAICRVGNDDDEEEAPDFLDDSNVHGITDLDTEEGGPGYRKVTTGWMFICVVTFVLQVLVVLILIQGAEEAGEGCLHTPLDRRAYDWWLLHLSKGAAIGVASLLLMQELMDVVNYAMVSILVEPHLNWEMVVCAISRVCLTMFVALANVIIFTYLKHAATVWINMTALAFISELGTGMLAVARRGVFGHSIMKEMTGLNFELTFTHTYPPWFPWVRAVAIGVGSIFCMGFVYMAFAAPDKKCEDVE